MDKRGEFPISENFKKYIKDKKLSEHDINVIAGFLANESIETENLLSSAEKDLSIQKSRCATKTMEEIEIIEFRNLQYQLINNYIGRLMLTLSIQQGEIPPKFKDLKEKSHKK